MTSNRQLKTLAVTALSSVLLAGACSSTTDTAAKDGSDEYANGVPELAAVQMSITADPASEAVATQADAVDPAAWASDELAATLDAAGAGTADLNGARATVHDVNQAFRDALLPIAAMVRNTPPTTVRADLHMWGPVTRGATEYRFFMIRPALHTFKWRLDARVSGTIDAYSRVAAGEIVVGIAARRGVGVAGFDLNALSSVDPNVTAKGVVLAGFAHGTLGTTLAFGLKGFTRDPASEPAVDALFQEIHLANHVNRLRLAFRSNLEGTATDAQELVLARVRHQAGVGGRSDLIATSGDVPDGHAWVVSQCWDASLDQGYRIVRDCTVNDIDGASCTVVSTAGDVTSCDVNLRTAEYPPTDPNQAMTDSDNPNADVTPPTSIPDVTSDSVDAG
jgi:hypothetical protein